MECLPTFVQMHNLPKDNASNREIGQPSVKEGSIKTSFFNNIFSTSFEFLKPNNFIFF